jgi:hypothetical protein
MRARVDALLTALARARVLEGRVQQQALAEGAWLLHCWRRAKSAAPVLLRVHVKLTGLQGRLLRSVEGQVGAAPRQQFGWAALQGAVDVAQHAMSSECWPLVALVVQRSERPRWCDRNGGGAWRAQSRAARGAEDTRGRNKNTYVFLN